MTLAYDHSGFGGRLSYVWRDDFLNNNEARLFANPIGIWRQPETSLDLQLNYDFNDNFAVSFDAVNITEEQQKSYYAFADAGGPDMFNFGNTLISRQSRWESAGSIETSSGAARLRCTHDRGACKCAAVFFRCRYSR